MSNKKRSFDEAFNKSPPPERQKVVCLLPIQTTTVNSLNLPDLTELDDVKQPTFANLNLPNLELFESTIAATKPLKSTIFINLDTHNSSFRINKQSN